VFVIYDPNDKKSIFLVMLCPGSAPMDPPWLILDRFDRWGCIGFVARLAVKTVTNIGRRGNAGD
jgi:hypothetical protein